MFIEFHEFFLAIGFWSFFLLISISILLILLYKRRSKIITTLFIKQNEIYHQLEALIGLYTFLKLEKPLPKLREWAISPDLGLILAQLIKENYPINIMELGSGSSTIIIGYSLKQNKFGKLFCLENDHNFFLKTTHLIEYHNLGDYVEIIFAPLKKSKLNGLEIEWYDLDKIPKNIKINFLFIDGPTGDTFLSRYPAIPILNSILEENSLIVLDDANRKEEETVINLYKSEYPKYSFEKLEVEKGAILIKKITQ